MSEQTKTDTTNVGLLFPTDADREAFRERGCSPLSDYTASQLELDSLIDLKISSIGSFFTDDERIIAYRQDMFRDLENHPELAERFKERRHVLDAHLKERHPKVYELVLQSREKNERNR